MSDEAFYPEGFVPRWWMCPACGTRWHDSQQQMPEVTAWDLPPECYCDGQQIMVPLEGEAEMEPTHD